MDERKDIVNQRQIKRRAEKASAKFSFPEEWVELISNDEEPLPKRLKSDSQNRAVDYDEIGSAEQLPMIDEDVNAEATAGPSSANLCQSTSNESIACSQTPNLSHSPESEDVSDQDSYAEIESDHSDVWDMDWSFLDDDVLDEENQSEAQKKERQLKEALANWVVTSNVRRIHATKMLHILHETLPFLPLDSRTLLKTMRCVSTKIVSPGEYFHFGIQSGLVRTLSMNEERLSGRIGIIVNIDGIPLTKSTKNCFWPITARLLEPMKGPPFIIGIYYGKSDPDDFNALLFDFVQEAKYFYENGFMLDGEHFTFKVIGFVCDAPARAKIKSTVLHNAYCGCAKCFVNGVYFIPGSSRGGRVTFPSLDDTLRTNENFRSRLQPIHHKEIRSIIEELDDVDMILDFPDDEMHLVDLGCMRKMLNFFKSGKNTPARLPKKNVDELSDRLKALAPCVPNDFARSPRGLDELSNWKATEFHFVLMYGGILAFKDTISAEHYEHFLLLYVSIRLLSSPSLYKKSGIFSYCENLLRCFVSGCGDLYGQHFISYNIHSLIHLAKSVEHWSAYGPLYSNSAYPFENLLQVVKGLVVAKNHMLQQAVKRIDEIERNVIRKQENSDPFISVKLNHCQGPVVAPYAGKQFQKIKIGKLMMSRNKPDNVVFLNDNTVFEIVNIMELADKEFILIGNTFLQTGNLFTSPIPSSSINTFKVSLPNPQLVVKSPTDVKWKACKLPICVTNDVFVVSPLPIEN